MSTWSERHLEPPPKPPLGRYRYVRLRWRVLFAIVDWIGWSMRSCVERSQLALGVGRDASTARDPRTILIVQLDHLGDAILSTGMLQGLRRRFPEAVIDVLASESNEELFDACPEVDRVYESRVNRLARGRRWGWLLATLAWGWRLRRVGYDLAIDPRGEFPAVLLMWLCGAKRRLGWQSGGGGFLLSDAPPFVPHRHEVESRQALLELLNIEPPRGQAAWPPRVRPTADARRWLDAQLAAWRDSERELIVLHIGAGTPAKRWPAAHWQELLGRLIVERNAQVVLVGLAADRATAVDVLQGSDWPGVLDWTGRVTLVQLAALLERADLMIGADSGPAHLAAAVGTPVVVLFSGTNRPEQWQPWGTSVAVARQEVACSPCHRESCPLADHPCLSRLQPTTVMALVRTLLTVAAEPPARRVPGDRVTSVVLPALTIDPISERTPT